MTISQKIKNDNHLRPKKIYFLSGNISSLPHNIINLFRQLNISPEQLKISFGQQISRFLGLNISCLHKMIKLLRRLNEGTEPRLVPWGIIILTVDP